MIFIIRDVIVIEVVAVLTRGDRVLLNYCAVPVKKYFSKIYLLLAATADLIPVMSGIANAADGTVQTARRIVKVGYYSFEGYHDIDNNGVRSGFGYEYIQNLLQFAP